MSVKIDSARVQILLKKIAYRVNNPGFAEVATMAEANVKEHFESKTDERYASWAPRKTKRTNPMLRDTNDMYNSIKSGSDARSAYVAVGTDYSIYHHTGTKKMAKRRFMFLDAKFIAKVVQMIARKIVG